jgi:hypothetical protein
MSKIRICALLSCVLLTGPAWATPSVTVTQTSGYYTSLGGEYTVLPNADLAPLLAPGIPFESFCTEKIETLSPGSTYEVRVNTESLWGGLNNGDMGPGGGDPLDPRTAYLYTQFRAGTLAGYDYDPYAGRANSAQALQDVIWYLEDEAAVTWTPGSVQDTFLAAANNAVDSHLWTGLGNVRVLNLYDPGYVGQHFRQDLLTTIPAPGTLVLVGLGTTLIGCLRRRGTL